MSSTYTADTTTVTPGDPTEITIPDDGDALNVASVNTALEKLADFVSVMRGERPADLLPQFETPAPVGGAGEFRLIHKIEIGGGVYIRQYVHTGAGYVIFTVNALYTGAGATNWSRDAAGDSGFVSITGLSIGTSYYLAASASPWATGSWVNGVGVGGVTALVGATGDIASSGGDIYAQAGNVMAQGTPVGDAGPGLVEASRFYSTGTAITGGTLTPPADAVNDITFTGRKFGDSATATVGTICTDTAGQMTITVTDVGAATIVADPSFTINFADGTFTTAPVVLVQFVNSTAAAITPYNAYAEASVTASALTITLRTNTVVPTAGDIFVFRWIAIGG